MFNKQYLNENKNNTHLNCFPIFFCLAITLHNIEEAIWLPEWSQIGHSIQHPVTSNEFYFAVITITALAYLITFLFIFSPEINIIKWMFVGFLGAMIFNALFPHLIATIIMNIYSPGLITGLILNVPINMIILYTLHKNRFVSIKEIILSTLIIGVILLMLIPFLFNIGNNLITY
ncbi:HXXEE domain-containing protein [Solibacillus sp. MA9]|uniref:HXXEE domain-containing protein n=1 Tax=Solibacillus palustris TaxID=2908203 RepID=A0ABS9UC12_9BACL|nr:HXXEE domain-containing protein [Solibacillus sp. MA9]MCH7321503.1 HXXEE domain-containing protein [Solibacillus sp. MA9]